MHTRASAKERQRPERRGGPGPVELLDREGAPWWIDLAGFPERADTDTDTSPGGGA